MLKHDMEFERDIAPHNRTAPESGVTPGRRRGLLCVNRQSDSARQPVLRSARDLSAQFAVGERGAVHIHIHLASAHQRLH